MGTTTSSSCDGSMPTVRRPSTVGVSSSRPPRGRAPRCRRRAPRRRRRGGRRPVRPRRRGRGTCGGPRAPRCRAASRVRSMSANKLTRTIPRPRCRTERGEQMEPLPAMLAALDLVDTGARTTEDIFTGPSQWSPHGRVFGGQVLAQSRRRGDAHGAARTRRIHSMHGYFLRPGDVEVADHVRGRPHPRRPLVLDPAHAGVPARAADPVDDRLVPDRGRGPRAPGADPGGPARPGVRCPTSASALAADRPPDGAVLGERPAVRHAARRVARSSSRPTASTSRTRRSG